MSPRHFSKINLSSQQRFEESAGLSNAFVAFTHAIGLTGFTYTPLQSDRLRTPAEKPGDQKIDHSSLYN